MFKRSEVDHYIAGKRFYLQALHYILRNRRHLIGLAFLIVLLGIGLSSFAPDARRRLNENYRKKLYEGALSRMYEYMFSQERGAESVKLGSSYYTEFTGGFKGLVLYTRFTQTIVKMEGREKAGNGSFYDLKSLGALASGIEPFISGETSFTESYKRGGSDSLFHYYNPKYIKWASRNLIPNPQEEFLGEKASQIYRVVFRRFFRMLTDSYLYLNLDMDVEEEVNSYSEQMRMEDFAALGYLDERYSEVAFSDRFQEYGPSTGGYAIGVGGFLSHSAFSPPLAIGFWCRRSIDGSDRHCWKALQKIMKMYDGDWFDTRLKTMEGVEEME